MFKTEGWKTSRVKCDLCAEEWNAVHHVDTEKVQCPMCYNVTFYEVVE